jgi:SAM-dependent methyltransferase
MMHMESQFYDQLTPFYHLIYPDWESSIARQAIHLDSLIREYWGDHAGTVLDVSCGIGTQALGLAQRGYALTASDQSPVAVERAKHEAMKRGLDIEFSVADMREAFEHHRRSFDVVIACDNAIPHLLSDAEILAALAQFYQCTTAGGGCIISVRDYAAMDLRGVQVHPYGVRVEGDRRYLVFQVWEFHGSIYDMSMYFVEDDGRSTCPTYVMRSKYYAVNMARLMELMIQAGYEKVQRVDGRFFQPVILGTRLKEA